MVIHDIAALFAESLLAAVGVCKFGNASQGIVTTRDGVLCDWFSLAHMLFERVL